MIAPERLKQMEALLAGTAFHEAELHPLAGDASFRRYVRVRKDGRSAMLMDAPPGKEDVRPFVAVAEYLYGQGFSAPGILARDVESGLLLLEDLGDASFTSLLKVGAADEQELYGAAIDVLAGWHVGAFSNPRALPLAAYKEELLMREIRLFSQWFLPQVLGKDKARALAGEYDSLWQEVLAGAPLERATWVHRDYHADNLMWLPEREGVRRVGLLDFQDGVYGDAAYDLVSLLEDARRDVARPLADAMIARYLDHTGADAARFRAAYAVLGAQRNSKIIGIFARLAARDGKAAYLHFLPRVWAHLERDLEHPALAALKGWLDTHVTKEMRGVISVTYDAAALGLSA